MRARLSGQVFDFPRRGDARGALDCERLMSSVAHFGIVPVNSTHEEKLRNMRRVSFSVSVCVILIAVGPALAQQEPSTDVIGAHANGGRGCSACHVSQHAAPWDGKGAMGSGVSLWGDGIPSAYGAGVRTYMTSKTPERYGILMCLTCHDGNYAPRARMKDRTYERVPDEYGSYHSPLKFIADSVVPLGPDITYHPVGLDVQQGCGGPHEWDCTLTQGVIKMNGPNSARFVSHYGFFNRPHSYEGKDVVVCTTCHNPHSENVTIVNKESESRSYRTGIYRTASFLRAPYGGQGISVASNMRAQYCRQCHADLSNEMNGSGAGSVL